MVFRLGHLQLLAFAVRAKLRRQRVERAKMRQQSAKIRRRNFALSPLQLSTFASPLSLLSNALLIVHMVILSPIIPLIYKKEIILKIPPTQIIRLSTYMIYKKFNRSETEMWPLHTCNQYHVKSTKYTLYK